MGCNLIFVIFPGTKNRAKEYLSFTVARYTRERDGFDYYWAIFNQMGQYSSKEEAIMMCRMDNPSLRIFLRNETVPALPFWITDGYFNIHYTELKFSK